MQEIIQELAAKKIQQNKYRQKEGKDGIDARATYKSQEETKTRTVQAFEIEETSTKRS